MRLSQASQPGKFENLPLRCMSEPYQDQCGCSRPEHQARNAGSLRFQDAEARSRMDTFFSHLSV